LNLAVTLEGYRMAFDPGARRNARTAAPRRSAALAAVFFLAAAAAAHAGDLADVKARGKLVMLTYPVQGTHFIAVDLDAMRQSGKTITELRQPRQFRGIDVELLSGFAKSLGVELEIHALTGGYGELLPALERRQGDLVASELTITPERRQTADFTEPYAVNHIAVVVRRDSPIAKPADLAGKRATLLKGSSHVEYLRSVAPAAVVQSTQFDLENLDTVEQGGADFTLMDTPAAPGSPPDALHGDLKVAFRLREISDGVAVRHGSDLLAPLNAYIEAVRRSGELARILEHNAFPLTALPAAPH
jgi:ABC-type amino acid transport substrate-binding protein